ncbi:MAG TPA: DUF1552 domain-containing protein, partial [Polyangiaceae bacterium]
MKPTNRRIFLRGLGGAVVAAPFLGSVFDRKLHAAPPAAPKRLIAMFTHNGCITTRFFPKNSHGPLTASDLEPTTLKYLAPYVDKLLIPRGIRAMNEWTSSGVRGQSNDWHTQVVGSYFTCQPVSPNSNDPYDYNAAKKYNAMPLGPSLDHVMAQQLSLSGAPLHISVAGLAKETPVSAISYSAASQPYALFTAKDAFSALTGLFKSGVPMSPDSYQGIRGQSIIDLVKDDLDSLKRFDMSASDKMKLEAWVQLLHDTGNTVVSAGQCSQGFATALGATQANVEAWGSNTDGADVLTAKINGSDLDGADLCSAIAVLAAVCNDNPVIFLKYPQDFSFKGLGLQDTNTLLAGRTKSSSLTGRCADGALDALLKIDDYYAQKFAKLIGMLDGFSEGDGKILDNTAAVWFQESSDGCARNLNNLPIIQAGSAGGYFKTGWAVNVEDGSSTLSSGNSELFCAPGTSTEVDSIGQATGTDPALAKAPINKYYCNLMNALGMRAG